jgi:hypothetical protein
MLRRVWSYWHFFGVLIILVAVALCLGVFGLVQIPFAQDRIDEWTSTFGVRQFTWPEVYVVLGPPLSVLGAVFTLYRFWHFMEDRLPERLQEYLGKDFSVSQTNRKQWFDAMQPQQAALQLGAKPLTAHDLEKHRAALARQARQLSDDAASLGSEFGRSKTLLKTAACYHRNIAAAQATLHLQRGLAYARLADQGHDPTDNRKAAIAELGEAIALDANDLHIHRVYIQQIEQGDSREILPDAVQSYVDAARGHPRTEGLARLRLAQVYWARSKDFSLPQYERTSRWTRTRDEGERAVELLEANPVPGATPVSDRDLATALELAGDSRVELNTIPRAASRYRAARDIFRSLSDGEANRRINQKLEELGIVGHVSTETAQVTQPKLAVIFALLALARAQSAAGEHIAAQSARLNARRQLTNLSVPNEIDAQVKADLGSQIASELASAAPPRSQTLQTDAMI